MQHRLRLWLFNYQGNQSAAMSMLSTCHKESTKHTSSSRASRWTSEDNREITDLRARSRDFEVGQQVLVQKPPPLNVEKGSATKLIRRYAGPYIVTERLKDSDLYRLRHCATDDELPPTNVEKLIPIPNADPNDIRDSCQQHTPEQARNPQERTQYQHGRFIVYLPARGDQADEGISLRLAQYLEPMGKAPVSEACKHLYSVYPPSRQIQTRENAWPHCTLPLPITRRRCHWRSLQCHPGQSYFPTSKRRARIFRGR